MKKNKNTKKGFTLIEILVIVFIIGLLASVILSMGIASGRDKAAINSYKTTMNSVKTAIELCGDGNRVVGSGINVGSDVCSSGGEIDYPAISEKCGTMTYATGGSGNNWAVVTDQDCRGCIIGCTVHGCEALSGYEDACR